MATIHFLNVKQGGCSIIHHNSGRLSVIDVCNAKPIGAPAPTSETLMAEASIGGIRGNFQQKKYPINPIAYLRNLGATEIFRYIQTHPDMDHMDGIEALFVEFNPLNFWDTENQKQMSEDSWSNSPYNRNDWEFYRKLRDTAPESEPRRLTLLNGATGEFYNNQGGDGLHILAPTRELITSGNNSKDYNDCSYVLLYKTSNYRIVFGGDSHDRTWDHILATHKSDVESIDLLIAPHHGRSSGRSYGFLDVLKPRLTFFGNARSEDLAYGAWNYRDLPFITNNQANCMVVGAGDNSLDLYVTNESFARAINASTSYCELFGAWFVYSIAN